MELVWILFAFCFGFLAKGIGVPPLVGYLLAGFVLYFFGMESSPTLDNLSTLGITLMLFTIGLKIHAKDLLQVTVWGVALGSMGIWVLVFVGIALVPVVYGISHFAGLDLASIALIGFALSYSSTVCVIKVLENNGDLRSQQGQLAVGILVIQDIVAVVFLVLATDVQPSWWALALPCLILLRRPILWALTKVGHDELLPLSGFVLAFGGYELFEWVGIKGDLGALVIGVLISGHIKSAELYRTLISFKDIFLIGFFLSIGLTALPTLEMMGIALGLVLLLPLKGVLFFVFLGWLKQPVRIGYLTGLILSNYSEFGLIVVAVGVQQNWLNSEWLVILALAVALSFLVTSMVYRFAHTFYRRYQGFILRFDRSEQPTTLSIPEGAKILVMGMGRVGKSTYATLHSQLGNQVWGVDNDQSRVDDLKQKGLNVHYGDGENYDFWHCANLNQVDMVILAMRNLIDIENTFAEIKACQYKGKVVAIARYQDQVDTLNECGIDRVFNLYTEAGIGFAEESLTLFNSSSK